MKNSCLLRVFVCATFQGAGFTPAYRLCEGLGLFKLEAAAIEISDISQKQP